MLKISLFYIKTNLFRLSVKQPKEHKKNTKERRPGGHGLSRRYVKAIFTNDLELLFFLDEINRTRL
jgi:hypothetical protein